MANDGGRAAQAQRSVRRQKHQPALIVETGHRKLLVEDVRNRRAGNFCNLVLRGGGDLPLGDPGFDDYARRLYARLLELGEPA